MPIRAALVLDPLPSWCPLTSPPPTHRLQPQADPAPRGSGTPAQAAQAGSQGTPLQVVRIPREVPTKCFLGKGFSCSAIRKGPLRLPPCAGWASGLETSAGGPGAGRGQPALKAPSGASPWTGERFPRASRALQPSRGENWVFNRRLPWRRMKRCPCGSESRSGCCPSLGTSGQVSDLRPSSPGAATRPRLPRAPGRPVMRRRWPARGARGQGPRPPCLVCPPRRRLPGGNHIPLLLPPSRPPTGRGLPGCARAPAAHARSCHSPAG